ncbi:MAG: flagellar hook-basal body complex protein [Bacillota bacterium]
MLRSLSTAVSGLRNHQNKLDVVGNNIANVNTVGYKYNTALFQDIFSQTIRGATAPQAGTGGVNPMQVGLGMGLLSSNTIHTPGAITRTGRETDLAIEGNGFFVVSNGAQNFYTRDGSFARDSSGMLVNANGMTLMGWLPIVGDDGLEYIDTSQPLGRIIIRLGEDSIAKATTLMEFAGNLDASKGIPSSLALDRLSGINGVLASGLQYGNYQVITENNTANIDAAAVRQPGGSAWLTADPAISANTAYNASILVEVTAKEGNNVTFTLTSHEYNKATGAYQKATLSITRDVTAAANLFAGAEATRKIGNIVFNDATGTLVAGAGNYAIGDKVVIDVKAQATGGDNERVQIGYDSPNGAGYDVISQWVFANDLLNEKNSTLRFFTLGPNGSVYDGFVALGVDTLGSSTGDHTTFTFTRDNESAYGYTAYAYDSLGNQHFLDIVFNKTDTNTWEYTITHKDRNITPAGEKGTLIFDTRGRLLETSNIPLLTFDPANGAAAVEFTPNFSVITQLVSDSNVIARKQDGFAAGELVAFNIQSTGIVSGIYTNGMIKELAQVAMASFINPEGLIKVGANLYDISANSGDPRIGKPGEQGRGMIQSMALEMSNVDLANEFTQMITTSRAFQANSRVISTSDEVLMELINIKR